MAEISIERYSPEYKDQVIDLLSILWDDLSPEERRKKFEWQSEKNPYSEKPQYYLAKDGDEIVGIRAFIVHKYKLEGNKFFFGIPANGTIHPDYQRQGLFSRIDDYCKKDLANNSELKLILSVSPNKIATKALKKYDYITVGKRSKMYLFSIRNLLRNFFSRPVNIRNESVRLKKDGLKLEVTDELRAKKIAKLMEECRDEQKFTNLRDEKFYEWRFSNPLKDYVFGYCTKKDELVGYVALDITSEKIISLLEYGYKDLSYFEELLKTIIKKLPVPIITAYVFTRPKEEKGVLSRCGFRDKNNWLINLLKRMGYISKADLPGALIKPISENITESDFILNGKDVRDPENWSLFKSDVH